MDFHRCWNDFFPVGTLFLNYYWVLECFDDNEDGQFERANRREFGRTIGYKVETQWSDIVDVTYICPKGFVMHGKSVSLTAVIRPFTPLISASFTFSTSLTAFAELCPDGSETRGYRVFGELGGWLKRQR